MSDTNVVELRPICRPAAHSLDAARSTVRAFLETRAPGDTFALICASITTVTTGSGATR